MRRECIQAVSAALGRDLNQTEMRDIEQRITNGARALARDNPQAWLSMSKAERLTKAGERAAQELIGEAKLKAERAALQIAALSRYAAYKADAVARGVDGLDALDRKIAFHADGKTDGLSIERIARGVQADLMRQLIPVMEASNPKWFGLLENRAGIEAITKEIMGEDSGNPVAKAGAKIWKDVATAARQRFNRAGGDIGQLDDWGMPHHHSQVRVARAGQDAWRKSQAGLDKFKAKLFDKPPPKDLARNTWVSDILPMLKREKYVNEDGTRMTDAQLTDFLREAWLTIATGGANKVKPGLFKGGGARANRGSASRQIHFKDAKSFIDYQMKYGEKTLFEALTGHIDGISKDIAMVEEFGPNPDHTYRMLRDEAVRDSKEADPAMSGKVSKRAIRSENLYNVVAGKTQPIASQRLAESFDTLRNWLTASRLGGAVISSLTDEGTLHLTARVNNLPAMRVLANELAALNPANKTEERMAMRAGLALNTFISSLNRFGQDGLGSSFSKKLGNTTLRASGLNAITEARRRAYGVTAMGALGSVAREHATIGKLDPKDAKILKSKGVSDEDFAIWKKAQLEDWGSGNDTMLTPDAIYRIDDAALDQAIGATSNKFQKMKDATKDALVELSGRDVEDQGWVAKRAAKLSQWVRDAQARLDKRIAKADTATKAKLQDLKERLGKLNETVEGARASWDTPVTKANHGPKEMLDEFGEDMPLERPADYPGINNRHEVGFYGKAKLRRLGMDEGKAREVMRQVSRDVNAVQKAFERAKKGELKEFVADFNERKAELDEFAKESQKRIDRRGKVADRIRRELLPAIADARVAAREKAVTQLLGMVLEETDMAVIEPGAKERAFTGAGVQRGTWKAS
jgi:uncharacterized protein (DUF2267 family)